MMGENLLWIRRAAIQQMINYAIKATASLSITHQRQAVNALVATAGKSPTLRRKLSENIRLGLGRDVSTNVVDLYFQHVGWFLSSAIATYHHGFAAMPISDEIKFDDSVRLLHQAVEEGRGVVITSPHWSGHELVAAMINRTYPMTLLIRQSHSPERTAQKLKWYNALGVETVLRPAGALGIKDAVAYLGVLKRGRILAITPDLLAGPTQGIETKFFGKSVRLHGGAFILSNLSQAPMMRPFFKWQSDKNVTVSWERAPSIIEGDRSLLLRDNAQDWSFWFEEKLRANPENWLFWLDKRWSRFFHATSSMTADG